MAAKVPYNGHLPQPNNGGLWIDGRSNRYYSVSPGRNARYPHLKDLQAQADAEAKDLGAHTPIQTLLNRAEQAAAQANSFVDFKQIHRAYIQYMQVDGQHAMFREIRDMIVDDNERSGIKPTSVTLPARSSMPGNEPRTVVLSTASPRPLSMPDGPITHRNDPHELFIDQGGNQDNLQLRANHQFLHEENQHRVNLAKTRPSIPPKPEGLNARENSSSVASSTHASDLEQRFSQLRIQRRDVPTQIRSERRSNTPSLNGTVPFPTEYNTCSDGFPLRKRPSSDFSLTPSKGRISGPREMPALTPTPPHPPKLQLDPKQSASFPRVPSPAYDPSRSAPPNVQGTPQPLRDRRAARVSTSTMPAVPQSSGDGSVVDITTELPGPNGVGRASRRARSTDRSSVRTISAAELKDELRSSNILVIDVRSRQDYDQGHIFATSVMCIEPVGLSSGMSAEELEDRLVVSPQHEQNLFERRHEFELVVYYDQGTSSDRFLDGPSSDTNGSSLRDLYYCLSEFNNYKPLRHLPVLLLGGLEAWMDLMTPQSLAMTQTNAQVRSARGHNATGRPGRPIGRVRMTSANSNAEVLRRRLREYNPLNDEEEKTWLEKARTEGVHPGDYAPGYNDSDSESGSSQSLEPPSPYMHSYDDFLRRFPEHPGEQQSMTTSSRPPPPPSRITPSMPSVPSRPPPAVPRPSYSGVSERDSSHTSPTYRQLPSTQTPLYTGRAVSHHRKLPRTGLVNFGVTCYMNATIQCLVATIQLSHFFLDEKWREKTQKNWKGSRGIMPEIYANLIRELWRGDRKSIQPNSFRKFCARLNGEWGVDRQQDAKEFFDFLVDCLHEDLNANWHRSQLQPLTTEQELHREKMSPHYVSSKEWQRYTHREQSYISDLFAGQHASKLRCTTCKHTSTTHEAFYSISVEIPRSGKGNIYDCLQSYCREEKLGRDELWKCPYCKGEREATKRITITRAPRVLVVHFKRFSASKNETARKIHTPIEFPLHQLNIEPYMLPPPPPNSKEAVANAESGDSAMIPPYNYDCYAVTRHLGTSLSGGHYIALVNDYARNCWRKFDDEYSSDFDPTKLKPEQRLQNEQAYLVFYIRAPAR